MPSSPPLLDTTEMEAGRPWAADHHQLVCLAHGTASHISLCRGDGGAEVWPPLPAWAQPTCTWMLSVRSVDNALLLSWERAGAQGWSPCCPSPGLVEGSHLPWLEI